MQTTEKLSPEFKSAIDQLVEVNSDSRKGYLKARDLVEDEQLSDLFLSMAEMRGEQAVELAKYSERADPLESSFGGKMHRWWMDLRSKVSRDEALAVLEESERGEDEIKARYEKVLRDHPGMPLSDVLHSQYQVVKTAHDKIRDLRDQRRLDK